jgi:hypothetical protein
VALEAVGSRPTTRPFSFFAQSLGSLVVTVDSLNAQSRIGHLFRTPSSKNKDHSSSSSSDFFFFGLPGPGLFCACSKSSSAEEEELEQVWRIADAVQTRILGFVDYLEGDEADQERWSKLQVDVSTFDHLVAETDRIYETLPDDVYNDGRWRLFSEEHEKMY